MTKPVIRASGVQPFTLLDFPGRIACVIFLPGCNFRCGYCHNPEFVLPEQLVMTADSWIGEEAILSFLKQRRGLLEGVVISGGEPTLHSGIGEFIRAIRRMGFRIKLDTNGSRPEVLAKLLDEEILDYVAMDIKTSLETYPELAGPCVRREVITESIRLIRERAPDYEFRTTLIREIHDKKTLERMTPLVRGAVRYALQSFRPSTVLDPAFASYSAPDREEIGAAAELFRPLVNELILRTV